MIRPPRRKPIVKEPKSALDPRPGGVPFFISKWCPKCKGKLDLLDKLQHPKLPPKYWFHDEWTCIECFKCRDVTQPPKVYYDWPKEALEELRQHESRQRTKAKPDLTDS
jgi:hypothetical protein